MSESVSDTPPLPETSQSAAELAEAGAGFATAVEHAAPFVGRPAAAPANVVGRRPRRGDFVYYGLRNKKLVVGVSLEILFIALALIGPFLAKYPPNALVGPGLSHPNSTYWLGTTNLGQDVFSQVVSGLRMSYLVGLLGAVCASVVGMALGFIAGWRGGIIDEIIQLFTNVLVMLPALVLLIVVGAYLQNRTIFFEGVFIGLTTWPWVARAVRAQTFSLRSREFVDLAKLSGKRPLSIIVKEIAPNMASYLFLVIILLFGSSMLLAASYDFLGIGPTNLVSLGSMMNNANQNAALFFHLWWWFIPPGVLLTGMVAALLVANVGLDEVFNPKLREQ
jgi:peptide/nickel transport system permease protein